MSDRREKFGLALRIAILLAFLAGQSLAFAHDIDHILAGDTELCATCSIGHNMETGATGSHACEWPASQPAEFADTEFGVVSTVEPLPYQGRAPPSATHH